MRPTFKPPALFILIVAYHARPLQVERTLRMYPPRPIDRNGRVRQGRLRSLDRVPPVSAALPCLPETRTISRLTSFASSATRPSERRTGRGGLPTVAGTAMCSGGQWTFFGQRPFSPPGSGVDPLAPRLSTETRTAGGDNWLTAPKPIIDRGRYAGVGFRHLGYGRTRCTAAAA